MAKFKSVELKQTQSELQISSQIIFYSHDWSADVTELNFYFSK